MRHDPLDELFDQIERMLASVRVPIPLQFFRTFEDRPFETCDFCAKGLGEAGSQYMIVKDYSGGELRQEVSLCSETLDGLRSCYSQESLRSMETWYSPELIASRRAFVRSIQNDLPRWLTENCLFCSRPKRELNGFFEYALCEGSELVCLVYPSMQCGDCTLKVVNSLSTQTLDMRRRFFREHFGPPPDVSLGVWAEANLSALR